MAGAFFCSFMVYWLTGFAGYGAVGDYVDSNLLVSLPINTATNVARVMITVVLVSSFPLQMHPTKNAISNIIWKHDAPNLEPKYYYGLVVALCVSTWIVGTAVKDLSVVLSFIG